jgi:DNA modification methylase
MTTKILIGDCLLSMASMSDQSVNCCVTSPPYFGLRDYGHDGQIGLEETPEAYVAKMVEVFREVRRVLRDDGTLWLNIGDSYAGSGKGTMADGSVVGGPKQRTHQGTMLGAIPKTAKIEGCKPKDLIGIPWMLAFALRADGWYLRQDIIWHKPNPMPESVEDRCTKAHEYVFLLSKSGRYFFDSEAMKEQASGRDPGNRTHKHVDRVQKEVSRGIHRERTKLGLSKMGAHDTRNRRSVWTVATKPYKGAHFATYPPELIRPCIKAGCPKGGVVLDPFGGSGTTAQVAIEEGRGAIICELNPDYAPLIQQRIENVSPILL